MADASPSPAPRKLRRSEESRLPGYLGIDPSFSGFAMVLYRPGESLSPTQWRFHSHPHQHWGVRLRMLQDWLVESMGKMGPLDGVCMEAPGYASKSAFSMGMVHSTTHLGMLLAYGPKSPTMVAPMTLKKFVTGKGNSPKDVMIKCVYQKWGFDTDSNDLADAYGLARLAYALASGKSEHKYERECLTTLEAAPRWTPRRPAATR